jgi:hypothetical protein
MPAAEIHQAREIDGCLTWAEGARRSFRRFGGPGSTLIAS